MLIAATGMAAGIGHALLLYLSAGAGAPVGPRHILCEEHHETCSCHVHSSAALLHAVMHASIKQHCEQA